MIRYSLTLILMFWTVECESLQSKNEVNNTSEIKIATLGTNKKSKAKRGKAAAQNNESASQDSLDSQLLLLTEQLRALEKENDALKSSYSGLEGNIKRLEDELLQNKTEKNTLQQRVDLLIMELNSENPGFYHFLFLLYSFDKISNVCLLIS